MSSSSTTLTGSNNNDDVVNGIVVNDDEKEETLSLPDDLWECLLAGDNNNGDDDTLSIGSSIVAGNNSNNEEVSSTTSSVTTTTTTSQLLLEEKFLSLEETVGVDGSSLSKQVSDDIVQNFANANHNDLDTILANEMNRLTMEERYNNTIQIHGIITTQQTQKQESIPAESNNEAIKIGGNNNIVESDEFINARLQELHEYLSNTSIEQHDTNNNNIKRKEAYNRVLYQAPEYVNDRKFLLMFLRGEHYNIPNTANRIYKHFEIKQELFGKVLYRSSIYMCVPYFCLFGWLVGFLHTFCFT